MAVTRSNAVCCWALLCVILVHLLAATITAEEPFGYFRNDWNVIGLKDYEDGTRITPENRLLLSDNREAEIRFGRDLAPLGRKNTKTLLDGWMPIVLMTAHDGPVRYDFRLWAGPMPTVKDWKAAYDWPTEGENFLNFVQVRATNTSDTSQEARLEVVLDLPEPERIGSAQWNLAAGASEEYTVNFPFSPVADGGVLSDADADLWQQRTIDAIRKINGCGDGGPWGQCCTLYPSKTGEPVVTYIHPGGHEFPAEVPPVIVKFFKEHAQQ